MALSNFPTSVDAGTWIVTLENSLREELWDSLASDRGRIWVDGVSKTTIKFGALEGYSSKTALSIVLSHMYYITSTDDFSVFASIGFKSHLAEAKKLARKLGWKLDEAVFEDVLTRKLKNKVIRLINNMGRVSGSFYPHVVKEWLTKAYEAKNRLVYLDVTRFAFTKEQLESKIKDCDAAIEVIKVAYQVIVRLNEQVEAIKDEVALSVKNASAAAEKLTDFDSLQHFIMNDYRNLVALFNDSQHKVSEIMASYDNSDKAKEALEIVLEIAPAAPTEKKAK